MRTEDAVSPVAAAAVLTSLIVYAVVYTVLFGFGSWYLLKLLQQGPVPAPPRDSQPHQTPARPISAAEESRDVEQ